MHQAMEKYTLRLPDGMRARLRRAAEHNRRSINSEIVHYLDRALRAQEASGSQAAIASGLAQAFVPPTIEDVEKHPANQVAQTLERSDG